MALNQVPVRYVKTTENAIEPRYQTPGSAAFDLHAHIDAQKVIRSGESLIIPTGLILEIPEGFVGIVASRSGHGFSFDITLANSIGVIDSDFRHEVMVKLINHNRAKGSDRNLFINPGDRIAQMMIIPVFQAYFEQVEELSKTCRKGGFGSTGQ